MAQAPIQADGNTKRGLRHTTVLDLDKTYNSLDRLTLLEVAITWLEGGLWNMESAVLGPFRIMTKVDPNKYRARMTQGVPQGAASSPQRFIMYIDHLAQ